MNPTIKALVSVVLMTATAACATQPTCSGKEMIAMKATGFDEDRIESMCTARRLDINAITQAASSGLKTWAALERAKQGADPSASEAEKQAAQLRAVADVLSRLSSTGEDSKNQ